MIVIIVAVGRTSNRLQRLRMLCSSERVGCRHPTHTSARYVVSNSILDRERKLQQQQRLLLLLLPLIALLINRWFCGACQTRIRSGQVTSSKVDYFSYLCRYLWRKVKAPDLGSQQIAGSTPNQVALYTARHKNTPIFFTIT